MVNRKRFLLIMVSVVFLLCFSTVCAYADEEPSFQVTTNLETISPGDYLKLTPSFRETMNSNVAILEFTYNGSIFQYEGFDAAEGVNVLTWKPLENGIQITVMVYDYNSLVYGELLLSFEEGADLQETNLDMSARVSYVVKLDDGSKEVRIETVSIGAPKPPFFEEITLITLSDIIDVFGLTNEDPEWPTWKFFDFNGDNIIDISDIAKVTTMIGQLIIRN